MNFAKSLLKKGRKSIREEKTEDKQPIKALSRVIRPEKKSDEELIGDIDDILDPKDFVRNLGHDFNEKTLEGLWTEIGIRKNAVDRKLQKRIMDNHREFIQGLQNIEHIKQDLTATNFACVRGRRYLSEVNDKLVKRIVRNVLHVRRTQRLQEVYDVALLVRKLFWQRKKFLQLLLEGDFSEAINLKIEISEQLEKDPCRQLSCLHKLRASFKDGDTLITEHLLNSLADLIERKTDSSSARQVFEAFLTMGKLDEISNQMERTFTMVLERQSIDAVVKYIPRDELDLNNRAEGAYRFEVLCDKISPDDFLTCFLDVSARISDILYAYYKIECQFAEFKKQHSDEGEEESMHIHRKHLWGFVQNELGKLLDSNLKQVDSPEAATGEGKELLDLCTVLQATRIFIIIGKVFSRSDSQILERAMKTKCQNYLNKFSIHAFSSLTRALQKDRWDAYSKKFLKIRSQYLKVEEEQPFVSKVLSLDSSQIYQKFLSGENVFLQLQEEFRNPAKKKVTDLSSPRMLVYEKDEDDFVLTSSSAELLYSLGRTTQLIRWLTPVSNEGLEILIQLFYVYFFVLFTLFGFAQKKFFTPKDSPYPLVKQVVQNIQNSIFDGHFANGFFGRKSRGLPVPLMLVNSNFKLDEMPLLGICLRAVGTESLHAILELLHVAYPIIRNALPAKLRSRAQKQFETLDELGAQYSVYFYRNAPTMLFNLLKVDGTLNSISKLKKWNRNSFSNESNEYVKELIALFQEMEKQIHVASPLFPPAIHHKLNCECLTYLQEKMVAQYAKISKCSTEGRAQMSLDQSELRKALERLKNMTPLANWDYMTKFVNAFYLNNKDLMDFVIKHPEYSFEVHKSIAQVGRAAQDMKKKDRKRLLERVEQICSGRS